MSQPESASRRIDGASARLNTELAREIHKLVPQAFADGKLDTEKLEEILDADSIQPGTERFGLTWPGKIEAARNAQGRTTATLKPEKSKSRHWDTTRNLYIEGDNLVALKILQRYYRGNVNVIYIDPPYNTGKDFVYKDNFKDSLGTYLEFSQQVSADGKKLSSNTDKDGRIHSNWLNMMYPRLILAHSLLDTDGFIAVSIDSHEIAHLRKLMDEVFGSANFAGEFIWRKGGTGKNDSAYGVVEHEYVVIYSRTPFNSGFNNDPFAETSTSYNLEDEHGEYSLVRLDSKTLGYQESLDFDIKDPEGNVYRPDQPSATEKQARWRWGKDTVAQRYDELVFKNGFVYTKNYKKDGARPRSLMVDKRFGVTRTGGADAAEVMFGKDDESKTSKLFDYPKPVELIKHLVRMLGDDSALVMDFFSGSGTTGHAVMELNAEDGGSRTHIQVQLPERTPEKSVARKAGWEWLTDLGRTRVTKAAEFIEREYATQLSQREVPLDLGVRVYSLAETNFRAWDIDSDASGEELMQAMLEQTSSVRAGAEPEALVTELLIKRGYSLSERTSQVDCAGASFVAVYPPAILDSVGQQASAENQDHLQSPQALVLADPQQLLSKEHITAALNYNPGELIIVEDCFGGNDGLKTNVAEMCRVRGIELWTA